MPSPLIVKRGEIYFCEPDPQDTVGSEQEKDRPWVVISKNSLHRGNCVVGVPLSKNLQKAVAHLPQIPKDQIATDNPNEAYTCVALTDQIRALDKTRFRRRFGTLKLQGLEAILLGLKRLFGINAPPLVATAPTLAPTVAPAAPTAQATSVPMPPEKPTEKPN